ncbi:hypothetical protein [Evansella cellulosilytica]|uniref:Uncharacterized protein n=1 Tax=Evansella cellulosilytica (strain ATCC 21833 / DSM 2522 / FERM P-1141 / JCM 9156 / N-4) TaxID=649639 RepID=E6TVH8_EVAC2|nr:hypothetical protein [Evansella cellulosilytica]ADU30995.1 hypothetical protein Bcell_2740 [Evansella cellulosilytica DSM 2522]
MDEWRELAKKNGIKYKTYFARINQYGWDPRRAATEPISKIKLRADYDWIKLAESNGISRKTYKDRVIKLGWDPEKASITPTKTIKPRNDRYWINIAKQNGIAYDTYLRRVHDNFWDPEEAATTPPMSHKEIVKLAHEQISTYAKINQEKINNNPDNLFKLTPKHIETAANNGICKSTVHGRVYNNGWTVQEAITKPVQKGFDKPSGYYEYLKVAKKNKINTATFMSRVKRGWSLEEAATLKPIKPTRRRRKDNKWIEKAIENGIRYKTYLGRTRNGWTPEEATTTPLLEKGKEFLNEERQGKARNAFKEFRKIRKR